MTDTSHPSSSSHDTIAASKTTSWDTTIRRPTTNGNGVRHHQLTGALVGSYCLTLVSRGVRELGWRTVKELRGRGYSVEAARALCDWGWVTLDVHRIERWAMAGNTGSCAVAEKLGFTIERTLRGRSIAGEGKPHS